MAKKSDRRPEPQRHVEFLDLLEDDMREAALKFRFLDDALVFLRAIAEGQTIRDANATSGGFNCYGWRKAEPWFAELWLICEEIGGDYLEHVAQGRAVNGVDEPVFQKGEQVGTITRYSDMLLMRLLEGRKPERYKTRHELGGKAGAPIVVKIEGTDTGHL